MLCDAVHDDTRINNAGRVTKLMSLCVPQGGYKGAAAAQDDPEAAKQVANQAKWERMMAEIRYVCKMVTEEFGLHAYYHPHCGTYIETPWEIEQLLLDVPEVKLIFDTAHITMGSHSRPRVLRDLLEKFGPLEEYRRKHGNWDGRGGGTEREFKAVVQDGGAAAAKKFFGWEDGRTPTAEDMNRIYSYQFKDFDSSATGGSYFELVQNGCFPELGEGDCDFAGVCDYMAASEYVGWVVVEQDILSDEKSDGSGSITGQASGQHTGKKSPSPLQSAVRNMVFMRQVLPEAREFVARL